MPRDTDVTWTVLSRHKDHPFEHPLVIGMIDCHSYDHAELCFEQESPDRVILGIYEGDVSWKDAMARYEKENT